MGFWDSIKKVDKVLTTTGATAAAVGIGLGAISATKRKREMDEREMTMREENAAVEREMRLRELEAKERMARLEAETQVQKANIMYGTSRAPINGGNIFAEGPVQEPAPRMDMGAMTGQGPNASMAQQKILEAHQMMVNGIITEQEFAAMKAQILLGK